MKIKKIKQLNDESQGIKSRTLSGLKVKTHVKAGPAGGPAGGTGGTNDIRSE